jgi:hypothetical protein
MGANPKLCWSALQVLLKQSNLISTSISLHSATLDNETPLYIKCDHHHSCLQMSSYMLLQIPMHSADWWGYETPNNPLSNATDIHAMIHIYTIANSIQT